MPIYKSDIVLGQRYREQFTGIEGTATAVYFFLHACERVSIEAVIEGKLEEYAFDAQRLINCDTGEQATVTKTGGPVREKNVREKIR